MKNTRSLPLNVVFLLAFFIVSAGFQCNDCDEYIENISKFSIQIEPLQSSYNRTDTIWISATFDSNLALENSDESYDNSNQRADIDFHIYRIEENNEKITQGIKDFHYLNIEGEFNELEFHDKSYQVQGRIDFTCSDTLCYFKIGILCHNPGIYGFAVSNGGFGYFDESDCQYNMFNVSFDIQENNFEICEEINTHNLSISTPGGGRTWLPDPESRNTLYFFKVEI